MFGIEASGLSAGEVEKLFLGVAPVIAIVIQIIFWKRLQNEYKSLNRSLYNNYNNLELNFIKLEKEISKHEDGLNKIDHALEDALRKLHSDIDSNAAPVNEHIFVRNEKINEKKLDNMRLDAVERFLTRLDNHLHEKQLDNHLKNKPMVQ